MLTLSQFQHKLFVSATQLAEPDLLQLISPQESLTPQKQLSIYTDSIQEARINALKEIYPVCLQLTGDAFFYTMARQYIKQFPSTSFDLAGYGEQLDSFIISYQWADELPYLSNMAKLEWAYHSHFSAADEEPFNLTTLQHYSQQQLLDGQFKLVKALSFFPVQYPVDTIWDMHINDSVRELTIEPINEFLLVYRNQLEVMIERLSSTEFQFLYQLNQQPSFAQACEALEAVIDIEATLLKALQHGWIGEFIPA